MAGKAAERTKGMTAGKAPRDPRVKKQYLSGVFKLRGRPLCRDIVFHKAPRTRSRLFAGCTYGVSPVQRGWEKRPFFRPLQAVENRGRGCLKKKRVRGKAESFTPCASSGGRQDGGEGVRGRAHKLPRHRRDSQPSGEGAGALGCTARGCRGPVVPLSPPQARTAGGDTGGGPTAGRGPSGPGCVPKTVPPPRIQVTRCSCSGFSQAAHG